MKLSELSPNPGSRKEKKRVGRGHGSGLVKTSGRGSNGQNARSGGGKGAGFEGGQTPWYRRIPHRKGYSNKSISTAIFRTEYILVNLEKLDKIEINDFITPEYLFTNKIVKKGKKELVKIAGKGEVTRAIKVRAHKFTESAKSKIEAAGGLVEVIS